MTPPELKSPTASRLTKDNMRDRHGPKPSVVPLNRSSLNKTKDEGRYDEAGRRSNRHEPTGRPHRPHKKLVLKRPRREHPEKKESRQRPHHTAGPLHNAHAGASRATHAIYHASTLPHVAISSRLPSSLHLVMSISTILKDAPTVPHQRPWNVLTEGGRATVTHCSMDMATNLLTFLRSRPVDAGHPFITYPEEVEVVEIDALLRYTT